jgi:hypothetical protein
MKNISALVMSQSLRNAVPTQGLDRFWDRGRPHRPGICAFLAQTLGCTPKDRRPSVRPVPRRRHSPADAALPELPDVLKKANMEPARSFTDVEDAELGTNHAVVGALLAKGWQLPERIRTRPSASHHDRTSSSSHLPTESSVET